MSDWKNHLIRGVAIRALNEIFDNFHGDEIWECGPDEVGRELELIGKRGDDKYPQERVKVIDMLLFCRDNRRRFRIKAVKTFPFWTWYYEII